MKSEELMDPIINLKNFREKKLNLTQAEFAQILGFKEEEQYIISRWEKNPDNLSLKQFQLILEKTGATYEDLISTSKTLPAPLDVETNWNEVEKIKTTLLENITRCTKGKNIFDKIRTDYINPLIHGIHHCLSKPQVVVAGRCSSGKSSLINQLLGSNKLPTSLAASTSIPIYLKHVDDMPEYIAKEKVEAWVFKGNNGTEKSWNPKKLYDEQYCRGWKLAAGGTEIIHSYGSIDGENNKKNAGAAVIFLDSPILKTCDITDLPGFSGTNERDKTTITLMQKADIVIYLSEAIRFMQLGDISSLKQCLIDTRKTNSPKNLFILASKADMSTLQTSLEWNQQFQMDATRFINSLSLFPDESKEVNTPTEDYGWLKNCFYTYSTNSPELCTKFNQAFVDILEQAPCSTYQANRNILMDYLASKTTFIEQKYLPLLGLEGDITEALSNYEDSKEYMIKGYAEKSNIKFKKWQEDFWSKEAIADLLLAARQKTAEDYNYTPQKYKEFCQKSVELCCSSLEYVTKRKCISILKNYKNKLIEAILTPKINLEEDWMQKQFDLTIRQIALVDFPIREISEKLRVSNNDSFTKEERLKIAKKIALTCRQSGFIIKLEKLIEDYWHSISNMYKQTTALQKQNMTSHLRNPEEIKAEQESLDTLLKIYKTCLQLLQESEIN